MLFPAWVATQSRHQSTCSGGPRSRQLQFGGPFAGVEPHPRLPIARPHRSSHFSESQLRLHLLDRKDKRELNSSGLRRELARCEEMTTMFHEGRVFLFVVQQCTSLAFKKNLGTGFPWRQLPNNPTQPVFVSSDSSLPVCRQRPPGVEDPAGGVPLDRRVLGGSAQLPKMHNGTIGRSRLGDL